MRLLLLTVKDVGGTSCGDLLYGRRFHLNLKGAVYMSHVRPTILYGSEVWCLKER